MAVWDLFDGASELERDEGAAELERDDDESVEDCCLCLVVDEILDLAEWTRAGTSGMEAGDVSLVE